MMPPYFLVGAGQEAGHVDEGEQRDIEAVAEADEAARLARGRDVEAAGEHRRLVGDDADGGAADAAEAGDDVLRVTRLELEEVALVHDLGDQLPHVVGLVGVGRHQPVERRLDPAHRVAGGPGGRPLAVVRGQEVDEAPGLGQRVHVVLEGAVGDAGAAGVGARAAQLLVRHHLVGDGFHHVGPGHTNM